MSATLMGGLGSASLRLDNGASVGALVAVNAFGGVTLPDSRAFWAGPYEIGDEFGGVPGPVAPVPAFTPKPMKPGPHDARGNTTIAIVATDMTLDKAQARRLAEVAHDGMARAIFPAHTLFDGDLVFAVSTRARPVGPEPEMDEMVLGHAAALCLARAIARAAYAARPSPGDLLPCWSQTAP
jgi:D-aminopeptidase